MSLRTDKTTVRDTWKVQAAMTTELDYGVGKTTRSYPEEGMRWALPLHLFQALMDYATLRVPLWLEANEIARDLLSQLGAVMQRGLDGGFLQRRLHLVLLDAASFYREHSAPPPLEMHML